MLRKEFQWVLKQSLLFLAVVAGMSLVIKIVRSDVGSYMEIFYLMYLFLLLWFGTFMGLSLFLWDKEQQAEEYVFSLPYSRLRLLGIKVLPRLTAVAIIYLIFLGVYLGGVEGHLLHKMFFTISWLYWLVFVMTLSFSASAGSYMKVGGIALGQIIWSLFLFSFSIQLAFLLKGVRPQSISQQGIFSWGILEFWYNNFSRNLVVVCFCLLIPYILSFILAFKKWGTYSKENYDKSYYNLLLPLIAVGFILYTLFAYNIIVRRYQEVMLRTTMDDMFTIGWALHDYIDDYKQAPQANSIKELSKILQPFYIKTLPLADAWENEFLYKVDPGEPGKYWIASPGSDGKFEGFNQEGTWKVEKEEKGQDIILTTNYEFTYKPDLRRKK